MINPDFDPYYEWLGIPSCEQPPNYYRLLGIDLCEDNTVIENAADRQMQFVRTFENGENGEASQKLLNEIAAAQICLLDSVAKRQYDETLAQESQKPSLLPSPAPPPFLTPASRSHTRAISSKRWSFFAAGLASSIILIGIGGGALYLAGSTIRTMDSNDGPERSSSSTRIAKQTSGSKEVKPRKKEVPQSHFFDRASENDIRFLDYINLSWETTFVISIG